MADTFARFTNGRITDRPVMAFPAPPAGLKQRPDYAQAYTKWHGEIEQWRKSLDDRFSELKKLKAEIDALSTSIDGLVSVDDLNNLQALFLSRLAVIEAEMSSIGDSIASSSSTTIETTINQEGLSPLLLMGA